MIIKIKTDTHTFDAELNDTACAKKIYEDLPLSSKVQTWGDEIYFRINMRTSEGVLTSDVSIGDLAYWPFGQCFCIFFGPTPMSSGEKPVPADDVFIIGKTSGSPDLLRTISGGETVAIIRS